MSDKKVEVKLTADTQALKKSLDEISAKITSAQEFTKALLTKDLLPALDEIVIAINSITAPMKEVDALTQKAAANTIRQARIDKEISQAKIEQNQKEIESIVQTAKSFDQLFAKYKEKDALLKQQQDEELNRTRKNYEQTIALKKQQGEDTKTLETEQEERIAAIKKEYAEKRMQSMTEYGAAEKAFVEKQIGEINKAIYEASKKGSKEEKDQKIEANKKKMTDLTAGYGEFQKQTTAYYAALGAEYKNDEEAFNKANKAKQKSQGETMKLLSESSTNFTVKYKLWVADLTKQVEEFTKQVDAINTQTKEYSTSLFGSINAAYKAQTDTYDEEITHLKNKNAEILKEENEHSKKIDELNAQKVIAEKDNNEELTNSLQKQIDEETKLKENATLSKAQIEAKEAELEKKKAKQKAQQEKIAKIERKVKLAQDIVEAGSNIAKGVTKALRYGPILGPVLAAIVTTMGAIQIGIMTKNLAKFEQGGLLQGRRHRDGGMRIEGTNIEVEGGEYVVNRRSTAKNLGLLEYINANDRPLQPTELMSAFSSPNTVQAHVRHHLEDGGQVPKLEAAAQNNNEQLLEAIRQIKIDSRVAVTDIMSAQDNYARVEKWVGF